MKNYSLTRISLLIAAITSLVAIIFMIIVGSISTLWVTILTSIVGVVAVFFICFFYSNKIISKFVKDNYENQDIANQLSTTDANQPLSSNEELKKWAEDKTQEIAILKANEQYRKEFLGNVSHEIKTPLFSIQSYIDTIIDMGKDDPSIVEKYLERTSKNVERLVALVLDLEDISKFETGAMEINYGKFDVTNLITESFELNELKAKEKNITLKMVVKASNTMVSADSKSIYEVFNNLIVNSINYGKEGGSTTVGIYDIDQKLLIEVKDTGIGIPQDKIQRIFERFYRVDKSRSRDSGGTGLGLAIVKHIIEAHGESITAKSKFGEGSTFSFTLKKAE